ncbi:hypothetical protein BDK51DRAFT_45856 [Blyttiomyces helicus]|uniref:Uncharacterized protein n=1 Tax=Blyttiomyces helicus TaxID=388810 RepID=A0A4P9W6L5_9FUNG|nr:hypothetical protein BDK51DRAFT_45856 [Blyttiomyces helicus]|eukprot:RKO87642.1 hypothetical protein BDK51DRAFT_45856 [Blyttiomyces helicus]
MAADAQHSAAIPRPLLLLLPHARPGHLRSPLGSPACNRVTATLGPVALGPSVASLDVRDHRGWVCRVAHWGARWLGRDDAQKVLVVVAIIGQEVLNSGWIRARKRSPMRSMNSIRPSHRTLFSATSGRVRISTLQQNVAAYFTSTVCRKACIALEAKKTKKTPGKHGRAAYEWQALQLARISARKDRDPVCSRIRVALIAEIQKQCLIIAFPLSTKKARLGQCWRRVFSQAVNKRVRDKELIGPRKEVVTFSRVPAPPTPRLLPTNSVGRHFGPLASDVGPFSKKGLEAVPHPRQKPRAEPATIFCRIATAEAPHTDRTRRWITAGPGRSMTMRCGTAAKYVSVAGVIVARMWAKWPGGQITLARPWTSLLW